RMTLYSSQGVPVTSWIVFGNAPSSYALSTTNGSWISDDMTDAAVKFLRGFERDAGPALAAIARNQGHQVAGLNLQGIVLTVKRADLPSLNAKQLATLDAAGVLALKITARSQAEGGVVVRGSDMRLRLKD